MAYDPPIYTDLLSVTSELITQFNHYDSRFIPPDSITLSTIINEKLEPCYRKKVARKNESRWFTTAYPDPVRLDQIAFIKAIRNDLEKLLVSNEETKCHHATQILLGSIIHRYKRLQASYQEMFWRHTTNIQNCALNLALEELFNINNKNQLDPHTIFTCCLTFRKYVNNNKDRYTYIKEDQSFFEKLDCIIHSVEDDAKKTRNKLKLIIFIQSVASFLHQSDKDILSYLKQLEDKMKEGSKEINTHFVIGELSSYIKCSPYVKNYMDDLIVLITNSSQEISKKPKDLIAQLREILFIKSQYTLLGAYLLILDKAKSDGPCVSALNNALNISRFNKLDTEVYDLALGEFEKFIGRYRLLDKQKKIELNLEVWDGYQRLTRDLLHLKKRKIQPDIPSPFQKMQVSMQ